MGEFTIGDVLNLKTPLQENPSFSNHHHHHHHQHQHHQHEIMSLIPNDQSFQENHNNHQRALHLTMMTFNHEIQIPTYIDHHHHPSSNTTPPQFYSFEAGGTSHGCITGDVNSTPDSGGLFLNPPAYPIKNCGRKKRKRNNNMNDIGEGVNNDGRPKEVVHVRAKRGQATDSHSLAERQRREKINEKLKCLQGLVPGCYKTMGLAVMLDVIINYIRSLQNQIDFLSMKLSAASLFYDFNSSDIDAVDMAQGTNLYEAQGMGKGVIEGYGGFPPHFQTSNWPL